MTGLKHSKLLASLTTAALAMPGLAAEGDKSNLAKTGNESQQLSVSPFGEITSDLKYSYIREDNSKRPVRGDPRRYRIDVWQGLFVVPYKDFDFSLNLQRDGQSGASSLGVAPPVVFNRADAANTLIESRTGATINDVRDQVSLSADYNFESSKYGTTVYYSTENDYLAKAIGLRGQWNFNKNNTILLAAASYSHELNHGNPGGPNLTRIKGHKNTQKYYLGLKQHLSKYNYIQLSLEYQNDDGYLNDPYKIAYIYGNARAAGLVTGGNFTPGASFGGKLPAGITLVGEQRPRSRSIWTPVLRFVNYIPYTKGALHFDYRYSHNSWDTHSHTFELAYFQPFLTQWEFSPRVRYYSQEKADFYSPAFDSTAGTAPFPSKRLTSTKFSSDYRLGGFGTLAFEARLSYQIFEQAAIGITGGYYRRDAKYKLGSKDSSVHPSNKGVGMKYASIDFRFKF